MEKSLKEISALTDLSYNFVLTLSNKISHDLDGNAIVKTKKGRKVKDESAMKSRLAVIVNDDNALTQKGMSETLQLYGLHGSQPTNEHYSEETY